jgi:hypothetical protein
MGEFVSTDGCHKGFKSRLHTAEDFALTIYIDVVMDRED